jgi:hypothetical protein
MRPFTTILFFLMLISCKAQNENQTKEDAFNVSHGVAIDRIDSSLLREIQFVRFDNSEGVIFPAEYGKQKFGKNMWWGKRTFFTPDTNLIKLIDTAIINQYCVAMRRFNDAVWSRTIENLEADNEKKSLATAKQQMADDKKRFGKFCPQWQKELTYHDKQYIGFVTEEGERIIYIQLLDFRQDPYNLKPVFDVSWIDGWHGWFETNTKRLHYHVDKNQLTINEGL